MRELSLKPLAQRRVWWKEISGRAHNGREGSENVGQMTGAADEFVVEFGRKAQDSCADRTPEFFKTFGGLIWSASVGVTTQQAFWKKSGREAATPVFSEPAMGWLPITGFRMAGK